ncbi:PREDICTED: p21-activated protein kinase-interacting protein 1-like [Wasmannia auropunctata]|uniref:p21-activated protein kinase-interacting protein 1-like n=1 Tax=Wasmannia auropunctata TaxID=64793 RepID=UPI0005EF938C|nr:PREDICTED: p21-activated protein kinase-interacting protein 1-like [Wasmannia auropunctata]XP_011686627.1 PREDICTED: p21-activated protein kinase-interacting protein 1-like [Wasmannia auropunctata]
MHSDARLSNPFEIIVGTYEQYLLGYKVRNIVNEYKLEQSFATHSHLASVRSVASSKHYLASAGADEAVCLYDMRCRRESGRLMLHTDTINCIAFTPEGSHLFACSSDGSITATRCGSWLLEKVWSTAHKGSAVNTLAIHPSGKLALSTGEDGVLRTWNLVKGRPAYATNLVPKLKSYAKWITVVKWSPSGERYLLAVNTNVYIYSVESAGIDKELAFDSKVICVEFLQDDLIAIGFEDGDIKFCDLKTSLPTINTKAHSMRVKCLAHINDLLVSASSSGEIKLWRYNTHSLDMLHSVNCGARITCLSLAEGYKDLVQQKEIQSDEEQEAKKKNRLRLKQEVIIENEEDLEVADIRNPKEKAQEKKNKKKRAVEDAADNVQHSKKKAPKVKETVVSLKKRDRSLETEDVIDKPKKKKKLLKANETNLSNKKQRENSAASKVTSPANPSNKKRRENSAASKVTSPAKKIKKSSKIEEPSPLPKKHKVKLPMTDVEDAPPRKMKKKAGAGKGIVPKKKRKKTTGKN